MKKLLLAFSLIAVFGIGITTASVTLPENNDPIENKDKIEEISNVKENISCNKSDKSKDNTKSCCDKSSDKS